MTASTRILPPLAAIGASLGLLAACGGGGSDATGTGTLRLALTDAPARGYDQVNVTVEKVRVHKSSTAEDGDGGWVDIALAQPKTVDLLSLRNGVLSELGSAQLEAGRYTQLRLVLASGANANTIVPTGMPEQALTTPSATQSGLKFNIGIDVAANEVADFVLDFDACKSIVKAGNSGKYLLKPVLTVLPRITGVQSVEGYVVPGLANSQTSVTLQQGGVVVRGTVPDVNGRFLLSPLPGAGTYDLVITANGRVTAVMTGVPVTATSLTTVNTAAAPINLADSAMGRAYGSVLIGTVVPNPAATVRALQTVGSATVEVASRNSDADDGGYELMLPRAAPVLAAYGGPAAVINFVQQAPSTAGKYVLEATVSGKLPKTAEVDLSTLDKESLFNFAP